MMPQLPDMLRILPEAILSGFAVIVMLLDPLVSTPRKRALGWLAFAGVLAAALALVGGFMPAGMAFGRSISADGFSTFFIFTFLMIAGLVLLGSMDYLDRNQAQHGEFYSLILFATVGMCFMAALTDLIMIFIGLEISSISS